MGGLKDYQIRVLEEIKEYFKKCNSLGAAVAFEKCVDTNYITTKQLPGLPYVCLRIPTGGGKTLVAAHSIEIVRNEFLQVDECCVLWIVPTNQIKDQTLKALKEPKHFYRKALEKNNKDIEVMDLQEALYANKSTYEDSICIIITTMAALRIEDINGRKVYESNGQLMNHFTGISKSQIDNLEKGSENELLYSLANALRLRRPMVIIDEAHNARTPLSFETLARFNPSAIIEYTATPQQTHDPDNNLFASNILSIVSAAELKKEHMIKLPIYLETNKNWEETLINAVQKRNELEEIAEKEKLQTEEYIRPILLIQAQSKSQFKETLTVEFIKGYLLTVLKVPEEYIKIQTGEIKELEDINLFDNNCAVRYVITVQALKEGWDCSFAYVLASITDIGSSTGAEQLIGRILRLPNVSEKQNKELNSSYAYVVSNKFEETLESLGNALIDNGFSKFEAEKFIAPTSQQKLNLESLFPGSSESNNKEAIKITNLSSKPNLKALPQQIADKVNYAEEKGEIYISANLSKDEKEKLKECFGNDSDKKKIEELYTQFTKNTSEVSINPIQHQMEELCFEVPNLCYQVGEQLELFNEEHFLNYSWDILKYDTKIEKNKLITDSKDAMYAKIEIGDTGKIEYNFINDLHDQLTLLGTHENWKLEDIVFWLDKNVLHQDIGQGKFVAFINQIITKLIAIEKMSLDELVHLRYSLREEVDKTIKACRNKAASDNYQQILQGDCLKVTEMNMFNFDKEIYLPRWLYDGHYKFSKHYYPNIGELKSTGEEFKCAVFIDNLAKVKYWVRNIERQPVYSFWLQTSTDKFYPDFIAKLNDGRILAIEYKGDHIRTSDDAKEKDLLGKLWAKKSNGKCLFIMVGKDDLQSIKTLIEQ